ncbi:TPA: hypothetical protein ACX8VE_001698 [Campylobacter jejuni]
MTYNSKVTENYQSLVGSFFGATFLFLLLLEPISSSYFGKAGILGRIVLGSISLSVTGFLAWGFCHKSNYHLEDFEKEKLQKIGKRTIIISFIICFALQIFVYMTRDSKYSFFDGIMPFYYVGFGHYFIFFFEFFYLIIFVGAWVLIFKKKGIYQSHVVPFIMFVAFATYIFYLSFCFDLVAFSLDLSGFADKYRENYLDEFKEYKKWWSCWFGCRISI